MLDILPSIEVYAVLLYAVPQGALRQLWNVIGDHLIYATIRVACFQWLPSKYIAAGAIVGLAIGAVYSTRSIHPPSSASALAVVIRGTKLNALVYQYTLTPIAINTATILLVALLFNALFHWRYYPAFLLSKVTEKDYTNSEYAPVDHADFVYALC